MRRHGGRAIAALVFLLATTICLWAWRASDVGIGLRGRISAAAAIPMRTPDPARPVSPRAPEKIEPKFSASAAEVERRQALLRALAQDDLCEVAKIEGQKPFTPWNLAAYLEGVPLAPELSGLVAHESPYFGNSSREPTTLAARFYQALLRAGLFEGVPAPGSLDPKGARDSLLALEAEDSENAAYPFFRIAVESRLGLSEAEILDTVRTAAAKNRFETFVSAFARELFGASRRSASHWLLGRSLLTALPMPNFMPVSLLLKELSHKYGLLEETRAIAALLMQQGQETELTGWEQGYNPLEYQVGRHLHNEVVDRSPAQAIPTFIELDRAREVERFGRPFDTLSAYEATVDTKHCERAAFDNVFQEFLSVTGAR